METDAAHGKSDREQTDESLRVEREKADELGLDRRGFIRLQSSADELRFAVSDGGVGIPEDEIATVFERYRQVAPNDRRGVGLYISKCIVSGRGGKIRVGSRISKGSTFFFTIPT